MPSKKQYNLVHNDEYDTRIPLHSEEAFHRGIVFHAKFIGSMEVPRPTSRMEIVAAMRRIRYEFKAKGIKKKKVTLEVSVDGLKVTLRKKKKKQHWLDESKLVLMHHPIYRIFYVSHDSHDLKIFSYIARDGSGNSFRCNVFKSSKKSQAMRVVRTVGQAFEVCHKLSLNNPPASGEDHQQKDRVSGDGENHRRDDDYSDDFACLQPQPSPSSVHKDISLLGDTDDSILDQPCLLRSHHHEVTTTTGGGGGGPTTCPASPLRQSPLGNAIPEQLMNGELTALKHEIQLVRERLDQQSQQTRAAVAHARLLQDQLAAETAARVEAQARTHQLLVQNKELLEHIAALVSHLREHERISGVPLSSQSVGQVTSSGSLNNQSSAVPDIAALGQYTSIWEAAAASCPHYSPLESYYSASSPLGYSRNGYLEDQLRYQAQIWENVRASSSPYPPPSPIPPYSPPQHYFGPGFSLPPSGRPRSAQPPPSPSSTLPRPSRLQAATSPNTYQQQRCSTPRSRSLERPMHNNSTAPSTEQQETSFIKPLPCKNCNNSPQRGEVPRARSSSLSLLKNNLHDLMRPLVLDPPPPGRLNRSEQLSIAVQTEPLLSQAPNCPVILLTDSAGKRSGTADRMSKIEETESGEEGDDVAELPRTMRRNSQ